MTPIELDKITTICEKWGLKELNFQKGIFIAEDRSGITVDLTGDKPVVGVYLLGKLQTEGHGNLKVAGMQTEIDSIMKGKTSRSQSTERVEELHGNANDTRANDDTKLGTPDTSIKEVKHDNRQSTERQDDKNNLSTAQVDQTKPEEKTEAKGGHESPLPKGKMHKAKCADCKIDFEITLDEARQKFDKYGGVYCQKCTDEIEKGLARKEPVKEKEKAPQPKVKMCSLCGTELSGARALECFQRDPQKPEMICENCEEKTKGDKRIMDETNNLPVPKKKQELVIGTCEAVAVQYGIPVELANLFFMKMNEGLYIKNPGLLYLAGKKGYSRIEVSTTYDEKVQEWSAECMIYPKLTKDILEGISKLDKDIQGIALDFATKPTNGTGRASKASVKMTTMHPFLKEMAQTRAQNRALRAFTGYGGTSAEELPEAQIERD